jgi:WD40 repeat protein
VVTSAPRLLARWRCGARPVTWAVAISPDGGSLACGNFNSVPIWDITDPARPVRRLEPKLTGTAYDLAFSPDGRVLAVGGTGLALWSTADGRQLSSPRTTPSCRAFLWADRPSSRREPQQALRVR